MVERLMEKSSFSNDFETVHCKIKSYELEIDMRCLKFCLESRTKNC